MKSKCKQTINKPSVAASTLCISQNTFNRLHDYTNDLENINAIAEKKIKRLAELKAASIELSKNWNNAIVNVTKNCREELLSRRRNVNEEKLKLIQKLAEQNREERAVIVKEAQKLILYKKPQCRLINAALFTSECFRELQAQLEFKKMLKGIEDGYNKEYIEKLRKDAEDYCLEKRIEVKKSWEKKEAYRNELKKQKD
ncbi:GSCOCG00008036001-RA-CDS [Cotesia congregata]|nr:GSCOCG00008036001-RA-CDS [Cotesia congregata]